MIWWLWCVRVCGNIDTRGYWCKVWNDEMTSANFQVFVIFSSETSLEKSRHNWWYFSHFSGKNLFTFRMLNTPKLVNWAFSIEHLIHTKWLLYLRSHLFFELIKKKFSFFCTVQHHFHIIYAFFSLFISFRFRNSQNEQATCKSFPTQQTEKKKFLWSKGKRKKCKKLPKNRNKQTYIYGIWMRWDCSSFSFSVFLLWFVLFLFLCFTINKTAKYR